MAPELRGPGRARQPGLLGRILASVLAVAGIALGVMLSAAVFAVAVVVAAIFFGWLWWKMRRLLKQARQDPRFRAFHDAASGTAPPGNSQVIEGEVIRGEWKSGPDSPQ